MENKTLSCLLVEDNPTDAKLIQAMISKESNKELDIILAKTLSEGLSSLYTDEIDVIILDLNLPDSVGLDTFKKVHLYAPGVPIIVLTGIDDETTAIKSIKEGAQDYIIKGQISEKLLMRAIYYVIERHRLGNKIAESEKKYRQLIEELRDVVMRISIDGTIQYCSPAIKEFGEYTEEEIESENISKIFTNKEELSLAYKMLERTFLNGKDEAIELLFKPKDKNPFYVEINSNPLIKDEEVVTAQCVMRNISSRRKT